jgi:hypothetical protein
MKKLIIYILILLATSAKAQTTTIAPCVPISTFWNMPFGTYFSINGVDTATLVFSSTGKTCDTLAIIAAYLKAHPCPVCPPAPVCPTCPTCPKQRTVSGFPAWNPVNKQWVYPYDDGSISSQ